ncbi:hypothetical protein [Acetobacter fallax]|uniref:DUF2635 domain-containing protein n=1 Tax=Acetobacter fallax TaxID=1737473 RepID=A0ABX0KEH6_9PROT|nr:hypothetical protein [Acetobacter fallax]NHO33328.1 hypothetical protein [Acetobacter fallax]NHO36949.1 hypothetical protein [Acetobacter fallax]
MTPVKVADGRRVLDQTGRVVPSGQTVEVDEKCLFWAALIRCGDLVAVPVKPGKGKNS